CGRMPSRARGLESTPDDQIDPAPDGRAVYEADAEAMRGGNDAEELRCPPGTRDQGTTREELCFEVVDPVGSTAAQLPVAELVCEHSRGRSQAKPADRE